MQSVGQDVTPVNGGLLTAKELLEITATPQQLEDRKREELKQTFMQNMVTKATNNGSKLYEANFLKEENMTVLDGVMADFKDLGFDVSTQDFTQSVPDQKGQLVETPIVRLTISWENAGVQ